MARANTKPKASYMYIRRLKRLIQGEAVSIAYSESRLQSLSISDTNANFHKDAMTSAIRLHAELTKLLEKA